MVSVAEYRRSRAPLQETRDSPDALLGAGDRGPRPYAHEERAAVGPEALLTLVGGHGEGRARSSRDGTGRSVGAS